MMRRILLFLLLVSASFAKAQDYTDQVDYYFQNLNKSQIPSDILVERVFPTVDLYNFSIANNNDTITPPLFAVGLEELKKSDYSNRWASTTTILSNLSSKPQWDMPVGLVNVDYNTIDKSAIDDNLFDIQVNSAGDSLLVDVQGRSRSPYLQHTVTMASPMRMYTSSLSPSFYLEYTRQDSQTSVTKTEVNFYQGNGWQNLNTIITPTFPDYGIYYIGFRITLSDGTIKTNKSKIEIFDDTTSSKVSQKGQEFSNSNCVNGQGEFFATIPFQGYDESQSYYGKGEYKIFQGGSQLDSLVIVVDGFDPGEGTESGTDLDGVYDFLKTSNLGPDLITNHGFDIVPLNFKKQTYFNGNYLWRKVINGGTDYIERNAMVLVTLIEKLNSCKSGSEPIKVVGFSMGGLIARYALTYMEANNIPHNVDLMATVDTPHQGAVVPKGLQDVTALIEGLSFGIVDYPSNLLQTPAARQMLRNHINSGSITPSPDSDFYTRFFTDLAQLGDYPQNVRKISITDGPADGVPINTIGSKFADATSSLFFYSSLGGLEGKIQLRYSPNPNTTVDDYYFRLRMSFLFIKMTIFKQKFQVGSLNSLGSLENAPAGYFETQTMINKFLGSDFYGIFGDVQGTALENFLRETFFSLSVQMSEPNFSFVPTKSALDFLGDPNLYEKIDNRNLVCSGEIPFDSYYFPITKKQHTQIYSGAYTFLKNELLHNFSLPNLDYDPNESLSGDSVFCGSTETYYFDACTGSISSWTKSSNLTIVDSGPYFVTVKPASGHASEGGYIKGYITGGGYARKDIFFGKPDFVAPLNSSAPSNEAWAEVAGDGTNLIDQGVTQTPTYTVTSSSGASSVYILNNADGTYRVRGVGSNNYWTKTINLSIKNSCGTTTKSVYLTPPPPDGGGDPCASSIESSDVNTYSIIIPCGSTTTYSTKNSTGEKTSAEAKTRKDIFSMKVYNFNGSVVRSSNSDKISIKGLKSGVYIIKGFYNEQEMVKKVLKQ